MTCLSADALRTDPQGLAFLQAVLRPAPKANANEASCDAPFAGRTPARQPAAKIPAAANA
jgi:hypothetical protein